MSFNFFSKPVLKIATTLSIVFLAGCQTTRSNDFSVWKDVPLSKARFNVMQASTVPVSSVQQRSRNNGEVQDERWNFDCGKGLVYIQHVSSAWFNRSSIEQMESEADFRAEVLAEAGPGSEIKKITSVAIPNRRRLGFVADVEKADGEVCQGGIFAIRGKSRRMYDNDNGAVDTIIKAFYCGDETLDAEKFASNLDMTKNGAVNAGQLKSCVSASSKPLLDLVSG